MSRKSPKTGRVKENDKPKEGKPSEEKKPKKSKEEYTHIDKSNGQLLRKSELNKDKPWIGPVSNQASVEKLTEAEKEKANQ